MNYSITLLLILAVFSSCTQNEVDDEICQYKTEILSPEGFEVKTIGQLNINGVVKRFQFVNEQIGYALLSYNEHGVVFKTTNGGQTWSNLGVDTKQLPVGMAFRDENVGFITVHDQTGCNVGHCQNKCVILRTENGGLDWGELEIEDAKGVFLHPKYDSIGNVYATLYLINNQTSLMKSTDNGKHWENLFSTSEMDYVSYAFNFEILGTKLYIGTRNGKILVVENNGQLVETIETNKTEILDLELIDEDHIIVDNSYGVSKTIDGGQTWEIIYDKGARMIGFDSKDRGVMVLEKSFCPVNYSLENDLIASTTNGGINWIDAAKSTTGLKGLFTKGQKVGVGRWYFMFKRELFEIKEIH